MSGLPADRNAPFAGWTPELMEACAEYDARSAELNAERQAAYAEGRKDEREHLEKIGAVADCPGCGGAGERMASFIEGPYGYQDIADCPDCKGTGYECKAGKSDARWWAENRANVIAALAANGLRIMSNAEHIWLAPTIGVRQKGGT